MNKIKADPKNLEWHKARLRSRMAKLVEAWREYMEAEAKAPADISKHDLESQRLINALTSLDTEAMRVATGAMEMQDEVIRRRVVRWNQQERGDALVS